ncbi:palmitoyltransferase ZDHHC11-like [Gigantopelta aegis]|uniref:palmitoyltransferase ZDHHC11-like n=1 Tax=Gigantopelta aegis TaxID=1735272 RepID=UPI001B88BCEC|nr:palmitoyltransferase ZDHHC11-like [Gigantopelta aegis]
MPAINPDEADTRYVRCRRNGWTRPPHEYQIIAWVIKIYFLLINFGMIVPSLSEELQAICYVVNGLASVVYVLCVIITTSINPAHEAVLKKPIQRTLAVFDSDKHEHVIENHYCNLCEVHVDEKTKHCRDCNKCISDFDHHCKWLNNCIGRRNYRWFIMKLASAVVSFCLILCMSLAQFIGYFTDRTSGRILQPYKGNGSDDAVFLILYQPVPDWVWLAFQSITILLAIICVYLLTALLSFHCYIGYKKISTFRLILQKRKAKEEGSQQERSKPKCLVSRKTWANIFKVNRVNPLKETTIPDIEDRFFTCINDRESHGPCVDRHEQSELQSSRSSHQASSQSVVIHSNTNIGPQHLEPMIQSLRLELSTS